jgi:opacity protein-like surface antigen
MAMWNLARCITATICTHLVLAGTASAVMDEEKPSEFTRSGFYLGVGGTAAFPGKWNQDFDDHFNKKATEKANGNAQNALDELDPPMDAIVPIAVTVTGADLEDAQFGINGAIGYRAGALIAFEVEGEWLASKNRSKIDVDSFDVVPPDELIFRESSTGSHRTEMKELWIVTANLKVYPPFVGWLRHLERFQPFAKVGLGVFHAELETDIETQGLTTTNTMESIVVPADFELHTNKSNTDAALRVGGGIDIYATKNIVSEINASYVWPFTKTGPVRTDYVSVQWRLAYRF